MSWPSTRPRTRALAGIAPAPAGWGVGMLLAFRDTFTSSFSRMQGEPIDARLINYILEHSYRWLWHTPTHQNLWSPPIFYPAPNALAYSDSLLSVAPIYWGFRLLGLPPDTAAQWWMLTVATLNYIAFWMLLRRAIRLSTIASALGALLFAFGGVRIAQVRHQQLIPHFYTVIAVFALIRLFEARSPNTGVARAFVWAMVLFLAVALQLYAAVYYGWFLILALAITAVWALLLPRYRCAFLAQLRARGPALATAAIAGLVVLAPLALHYAAAARNAGYWDFSMVSSMLPRLQSWIYMGPQSWLYHRLTALSAVRAIPMEHEQRLGLGIVTTACVLGGFWLARRQPLMVMLALTSLTLMLLVTEWPGGATAWRLVYDYVPGAGAMRAVSRVGLILLIPAAIGLAWFVDRWRTRSLAVIAIAAVVILEQGQTLLAYDKLRARARGALVAEHIPNGCHAFLFTALHGREDPWLYHVDAMWAEMARAVPAINGYSGRGPADWPFYAAVVRDSTSGATLDRALTAWLARWNVDPHTACHITFAIDSMAASR